MITTRQMIRESRWKAAHVEGLTALDRPAGDLPREWEEKLRIDQEGRRGDKRAIEWWTALVEDVHLCGPALVGLQGGKLVLDVGFYGRVDLWERNRAYYQAGLGALRTKAVEVERAISLASCWSGNYFHWVIDELPKVMSAVEEFEEVFGPVEVLTGMNRAPFVRPSLELLNRKAREWTEEEGYQIHYHVKELCVITPRRVDGFVAPGAVKDDLPFVLYGRKKQGKKLYISRAGAQTRRVVNERELVKMLEAKRFSVVQPEGWTFERQMREFSEASVVVGAHGAGLANVRWMEQSGGQVVELVAPQYTNPCCWLVGAAKGLRYGAVIGEGVGVEDLRVDVEKVAEVLGG